MYHYEQLSLDLRDNIDIYDFDSNMLNLNRIRIELINFDKRFFYGFINYVYKYPSFKYSSFLFIVQLIRNIRNAMKSLSKKIEPVGSASKGDLFAAEISFPFFAQFLVFLSDSVKCIDLNKNDEFSFVKNVKSYKIVGVNLIEHDVIIRTWFVIDSWSIYCFHF